MQLKGVKTTQETVQVDVSLDEILGAVMKVFDSQCPSISGDKYIDRDGFWQIYSYTHPHNGDDEYRRGDRASLEDIELMNYRDFVVNLFKKEKFK